MVASSFTSSITSGSPLSSAWPSQICPLSVIRGSLPNSSSSSYSTGSGRLCSGADAWSAGPLTTCSGVGVARADSWRCLGVASTLLTWIGDNGLAPPSLGSVMVGGAWGGEDRWCDSHGEDGGNERCGRDGTGGGEQ